MELSQLMNIITIPLKSIQNIQLTPADFYLLENIIHVEKKLLQFKQKNILYE